MTHEELQPGNPYVLTQKAYYFIDSMEPSFTRIHFVCVPPKNIVLCFLQMSNGNGIFLFNGKIVFSGNGVSEYLTSL